MQPLLSRSLRPQLAADLPARTYTKAPAYTAPEVVYNWTGFYIGGHIGGAFPGDNSLESSNGRFLGGVQGGFDYQFAPNWVIGAEAQYSWLTGNSGNGVLFPAGTLVTANTDQIGSVTGRLGYTWGPALLYAKGGYAWRDNDNVGVSLPAAHRSPLRPLATTRTVIPWVPASNTCSRRTGPSKASTSITTSAVPPLPAGPRRDRWRPVPGRRAYRQAGRQLSLRLGWPGGREVLIRNWINTERAGLRRPFFVGLPGGLPLVQIGAVAGGLLQSRNLVQRAIRAAAGIGRARVAIGAGKK